VSDIALFKMPTAGEIFGRRLAPAPWLSSRPLLALIVEMLPTIEDDLTADLVEHLALAFVAVIDELRAVRVVLSSALALSHTQHVEILRLRRRLADLRDARRRERRAAA
jgi:hypothetical protein